MKIKKAEFVKSSKEMAQCPPPVFEALRRALA